MSRLGFEHSIATFRLRGKRSSPLRHRRHFSTILHGIAINHSVQHCQAWLGAFDQFFTIDAYLNGSFVTNYLNAGTLIPLSFFSFYMNGNSIIESFQIPHLPLSFQHICMIIMADTKPQKTRTTRQLCHIQNARKDVARTPNAMGIQSTPLTTDATLVSLTPTITSHLATRVCLQVNYFPLAQLYLHQKPAHRTTLLQPHQARIRR